MRVCVVAMSDMSVDPRPRRHADLLAAQGIDVTGVGYRSDAQVPTGWRYVTIDEPPWSRQDKALHAARLAATRALPALGERTFWHQPGSRPLLEAVRSVDADLYVSHDLWALPIVARVAKEHAAEYAFEAREYYVGQHADRPGWRLLWPAYADRTLRRYITDAKWVSTVSEGLADWLRSSYDLPVRPTVVRSIPASRDLPAPSVPGEMWTVLFHGNLRPDRNVHGVIDSVQLWREHLRLVVRGNGPADYVASLHDQVARTGLGDRASIEPAVPFGDVIAAAASADIGVIPWSLDSPQKRFALPNKLFEYLAAGLCVVQTGPSEAADLVSGLDAGLWYPQATPEALAGALNSLTREQLVAYKEAAHRGMSALTWESEQQRLWALYP